MLDSASFYTESVRPEERFGVNYQLSSRMASTFSPEGFSLTLKPQKMLMTFSPSEGFPRLKAYLAGTGDALHLSPGHDVRVPGLSVLMVAALPVAASAGEDVEAVPGQARPVVQILRVALEDGRGREGQHLLVHRRFLGTNLAAVQRVLSPGVLAEAGGERRTLLFITMHS